MTEANTKSLPDSSASPNATLRLSLVGGGEPPVRLESRPGPLYVPQGPELAPPPALVIAPAPRYLGLPRDFVASHSCQATLPEAALAKTVARDTAVNCVGVSVG
jgi:hypothetical protein